MLFFRIGWTCFGFFWNQIHFHCFEPLHRSHPCLLSHPLQQPQFNLLWWLSPTSRALLFSTLSLSNYSQWFMPISLLIFLLRKRKSNIKGAAALVDSPKPLDVHPSESDDLRHLYNGRWLVWNCCRDPQIGSISYVPP